MLKYSKITVWTVIYSKLYKIDILTRLPFIKEETRIFQKLSLLGPTEVGSPVYTVNIYKYKAIGANATSSVILYTGKCISPCLEIL